MAAKKKVAGAAKQIHIPEQTTQSIEIPVGGPLYVAHRFSEKMKRKMLEAQQPSKKATKNKREDRDPTSEYEGAKYVDQKGREGIPCAAFRKAMIDAASFVEGVTKVQIRGAVFVQPTDKYATTDDGEDLVLIDAESEGMLESVVRLSNGSADLRYRPAYRNWVTNLVILIDPDVITPEACHHLVQRAGFAIGVGESRPQKNGDWGRFEIVKSNVRRLPKRKKAASKKTTAKRGRRAA